MRRLITVLIIAGALAAQPAVGEQVVRVFGGSSTDKIYCAATSSDSGVVMTGYAKSFGVQGKDLLLAKANKHGYLLWTRILGGSSDEEGRCVIETHDGGLVVTGFQSAVGGGDNLLLCKFDSDGDRVWSHILDCSDGELEFYGHSVIEDSDNDLVVTGKMWRNSLSRYSLLFAKFDSNGNWKENQTRTVYTLPSIIPPQSTFWDNFGYSVVEQCNGEYLVVGKVETGSEEDIILVEFGPLGGLHWGWRIGNDDNMDEMAYSIIRTPDCGFAIAGERGDDLLLLRRDSAIDSVWTKRLTSGSSVGRSVVGTSDGGFVLTGRYSGGSGNVLLAKWDGLGNHAWTSSFGDTGDDKAYSVTEDFQGNLLVAGYTNSWGQGGYDAFIAKADGTGATCLENQGGPGHTSWTASEGVYYVDAWIPQNVFQGSWSPPNDTFVLATSSAVCCCLCCGDFNRPGDTCGGDGVVNIADMTFIIAYLYGAGPSPNPLCLADINHCDGIVQLSDMTYIIAYLYGAGPPPDCCPGCTDISYAAEYAEAPNLRTRPFTTTALTMHRENHITVDSITGLDVNGMIVPGEDIKFIFRFTNPTEDRVIGFNTGFRVYSPDGATWQPISLDTFNVGWPVYCDFGPFINYFSANGSGADTAYIAGASMPDGGFPPAFDEQAWWIATQVNSTAAGKQLCVDSSWFPPGGGWEWGLSSNPGYPALLEWGGPYCFRVGGCIPPIRGNVDYDPADVIDISDLVYLVDYMFTLGPVPPCFEEADMNCDGQIHIADLVYLVDYMFTGGPPPCRCDCADCP